MNRFAALGLSTALTAGALAPAVVAADPAPLPAARSADDKPWYSRLFGGSESKPNPEKTFADVPARPPVIVGPLDPTALTEALRLEQDAWQRRMDVCHQLREIAAKRNDDKLSEQAEELERHATSLYHQRTARLGVKNPRRAAAADALDADVPVATSPSPTEKPQAAPRRQFREVTP